MKKKVFSVYKCTIKQLRKRVRRKFGIDDRMCTSLLQLTNDAVDACMDKNFFLKPNKYT